MTSMTSMTSADNDPDNTPHPTVTTTTTTTTPNTSHQQLANFAPDNFSFGPTSVGSLSASESTPISPFSRTAAALDQQLANSNRLYSHVLEEEDNFQAHRRSTSTVSSIASTSANISMSFNGINHNNDLPPALITPNDFQDTLQSYNNVLDAAARYRNALLEVSSAAAEFGSALEECSRCKGAGNSSDGLLAAGGLHYLVSNHEQILAESVQRSFEQPVQQQLEILESTAKENEKKFKHQIKHKSKQLKQQEKLNAKLQAQSGIRNLSAYRRSLQELTAQIDDIDGLKHQYFESAFDLAQNTSNKILTFASSIVRAEVEIYEGIARKGWSGGGLDHLISSCPDPFAKDDDDDYHEDSSEPEQDDLFGINHFDPQVPKPDTIYSVLPERSILPPQLDNTSVDEDGPASPTSRLRTQESKSTITITPARPHSPSPEPQPLASSTPEPEPEPEPHLESEEDD